MPISQHHINELKEIYLKQTGEMPSDKEAWEMAIRLVNFFRLLLEDNSDSSSQYLRSRIKNGPTNM